MRLRFQCRKSTDHTKIYVSTAARQPRLMHTSGSTAAWYKAVRSNGIERIRFFCHAYVARGTSGERSYLAMDRPRFLNDLSCPSIDSMIAVALRFVRAPLWWH